MPANKKPRKKYKPKPILQDPVGFVTERITPVAKHDSYLLDLKIRNSGAMAALMQGHATKRDMDTLIAMSNITEALHALGFGKEYGEVAVDGREAILKIVWRAVDKLRFVPTGPEIQALNTLMELHDAQMDVITVQDMEKALVYAKKQLRDKKATKLPPVPAQLQEPV
jgi:hypothetical protein